MARRTRRDVLSLGVGALTAPAGCNRSERRGMSSPSPPGGVDPIPGVDGRTLRFEGEEDVLVDTRHEEESPARDLYVVDDEDSVDPLEFRGEPTETDDPRTFLREIDYTEATGLVVQLRVSACYRHALLFVERRDDGSFRARFCRTMREPSVACSIDDTQVQVTMIEVPVVYDSGPPGGSVSTGSTCKNPPGEPDPEGRTHE